MDYLLSEIARITGGETAGCDTMVKSVFIDSRQHGRGAGAMFAAISGRNHDGHGYINELYARGIRAFMIERDLSTDQYPEAGFLRVESSIGALQALAADYRSRFHGTVVGITGSNGKTVTKEWIAQMAPRGIKLFRSPRSYNSQVGVPLSVLMIEGDEDVVLLEAGISQSGEMGRLEKIVRPDIGVITTIGDAHQENFASREQKLDEKLNLFAHSATIIYNSEYPEIEAAVRIRFAGHRLVDAATNKAAAEPLAGKASQQNGAMALAVWQELVHHGIATQEVPALRPESLQPVAMRLDVEEGLAGAVIVNDSYNCDINSLAIALDYLRNIGHGRRKIVVLSDILQSGMPKGELYRRVDALVEAAGVEHLIGIGDDVRNCTGCVKVKKSFFPTPEAFLQSVKHADIAGAAILVKGNRSAQFEAISHALRQKSHTTVLEVDLDAMVHNLNHHRSRLPAGTLVMAMVKASAYGHGAYEVAGMLQHEGVAYLAVAFADEGVVLRERGITMPIVVLNADADSFDLMIAHNLEPEIYNLSSLRDFIKELEHHGEFAYPIHIKLDTGMHRLGFMGDETDELLSILAGNERVVRVASIFSHLAASDDPAEDDFSLAQIARFEIMSDTLIDALGYTPLRHIANSAAIERFPQAAYDMCRLGIGLYGIGDPRLRAVASLRSRIVQIRELAPGETVGYGRSGSIPRPTRVATIPVGYADGLDRRLGEGHWSLIIGESEAPLIGRVCMDTCMADVTEIDCREGDTVEIYGSRQGNRVEDMARILDTIPYEVMTSISARVKRIYRRE